MSESMKSIDFKALEDDAAQLERQMKGEMTDQFDEKGHRLRVLF